MTTTEPTARQLRVYRAVVRHWAEHGRSPSVRELCDALKIGSPNGVMCHLRAMERDGLVEMAGDPGDGRRATARGIWPAGLRQRIRAAAVNLEVARERA